MHDASLLRMKWFVETYIKPQNKAPISVLDVGSQDFNGSYRSIFSGTEFRYSGLDLESGPNVDIVAKTPYDWNMIQTDTFDVVISGQAFEHIEFFWLTLGEMVRVLKQNGLLCIIAPSGFGEHRYPVDCYRFFTDGMIALSRYANLITLHAHSNAGPVARNIREFLVANQWYSRRQADSMLIAKKPYSGPAKIVALENYKCCPQDLALLRSPLVNYTDLSKGTKFMHLILEKARTRLAFQFLPNAESR